MIPLWLFTLGRVLITDDMRINIPFFNIIVMLACYVIPVLIGLLIQRYAKRLSSVIVRCLRPIYVVFILLMFTFGVWTNLYVFRLIRPLLLLAGCLLPYVGFTLSAVVAFILRQPPPRVLTIAIETGIQNTGVPIVLMKFSLDQPEADLSIVAPIVIAMFMPLPLWIAFAVITIRRRSERLSVLRAQPRSGRRPGRGCGHCKLAHARTGLPLTSVQFISVTEVVTKSVTKKRNKFYFCEGL